MTFRPPRGGKSENSGEDKQRGPRSSAARSTFRHAARITAARIGEFDRPHYPRLTRFARAVLHEAAHHTTRRRHPAERPDHGRAQAIYDAELGKWQARIDAAANDVGLSRDQRAAAVAALRVQQQVAAKIARQRAMQDEKQRVRASRRAVWARREPL